MKLTAPRLQLLALLILAAVVFTVGINWGLPSRLNDQFLLGADNHGARLEALTAQVPEVDPTRGADVVQSDASPNEAVPLNDTDAKRAQILCRYRLYSDQPDEMITFRALSVMKPRQGDFDPRLYQYGGLWIYPVGGLIEAAHILGLVKIADRATYIAHPEIFGRFYIVARLYSAAWGVVAIWAIFTLLRRLTISPSPGTPGEGRGEGSLFLPWLGAFCCMWMPVLVNAAHEAKPHLPGVALVLLAILAADQWLRTSKARWAWLTGILCGAAAGMVLWGVVAWLIIPAVLVLRLPRLDARPVAALAAAIMTYALTNPYVIYHLLRDPAILKSNLGNTAAMYSLGMQVDGPLNALLLSAMAAGPAAWLFGIGAAMALLVLWIRRPTRGCGVILSVVALAAAFQFTLTAGGKPPEYARFALVPAIAMVAAMTILAARQKHMVGYILMSLVCAGSIICGSFYLAGFLRDAPGFPTTSRRMAAVQLQKILDSHPGSRLALVVYSDPAPYCLPPVDLDRWEIMRFPIQKTLDVPAVDIEVNNFDFVTGISWADKKFLITDESNPN